MKTERMEIAELVTRVFGSHHRRLHRYLSRMLRSDQAAEEVAQNTYLKFLRLCKPEDVQCPEALLFSMATRLALDYSRVEGRRSRELGQPDDLDRIHDGAATPDRQAAVDEAMKHVESVIGKLRPTYRAAFSLRFYNQLNYKEIGERLQITEDAAQQRVAAAKEEVESRLLALGIDPRDL